MWHKIKTINTISYFYFSRSKKKKLLSLLSVKRNYFDKLVKGNNIVGIVYTAPWYQYLINILKKSFSIEIYIINYKIYKGNINDVESCPLGSNPKRIVAGLTREFVGHDVTPTHRHFRPVVCGRLCWEGVLSALLSGCSVSCCMATWSHPSDLFLHPNHR